MEGRGLSIVEHSGFSVQGKTKQEVDGEVCGALHDRGSSVVECGKIAIAKFDEDPSGGKHKLDSKI